LALNGPGSGLSRSVKTILFSAHALKSTGGGGVQRARLGLHRQALGVADLNAH
jgi:hypothetical protein